MISKILSTIGIVFVASLLLVGCDEAADEAKKSEPATKSAASGSSQEKVKLGGTLDKSTMTEAEKKTLEMVEKAHKATDCGGFDQTCRSSARQESVNLYAIKDEKSETEGGATTTRTNDGRNRGSGLWSKLKKKK
jgi:hypothetical protein